MRLRDIVLCSAIGASALTYGCSSAPEQLEPAKMDFVHGIILTKRDFYPALGFTPVVQYTMLPDGQTTGICLQLPMKEYVKVDVLDHAMHNMLPVLVTPKGFKDGCYNVKEAGLYRPQDNLKPEAEPQR